MRNVHDDHASSAIGDRIAIEIQANAFLHHMVRNIVGSLLPIGRGERPGNGWRSCLTAAIAHVAGATAPATGLTLLYPLYPAQYGLPEEVTLR